MKKIDTSITHITSKNTNLFEDLGFDPNEANKLKIKAQLMCQISEWIKIDNSPLDIDGINLNINGDEIVDIVRESRNGKNQ